MPFSNGTLAYYPRYPFSSYDVLHKGSASYSHPRTASGRHGVARYGPPRLPWCNAPALRTPRTADASEGRLCLSSATYWCTHGWMRSESLLDGEDGACHSTVFHSLQVLGSRDAHTDASVCTASRSLSPQNKPSQNSPHSANFSKPPIELI